MNATDEQCENVVLKVFLSASIVGEIEIDSTQEFREDTGGFSHKIHTQIHEVLSFLVRIYADYDSFEKVAYSF